MPKVWANVDFDEDAAAAEAFSVRELPKNMTRMPRKDKANVDGDHFIKNVVEEEREII